MAQPLTLEMAHANPGAMVLKRDTRRSGRLWMPVKLVGVFNDETAIIRPPGHTRDEYHPIADLKLSGKQSAFGAKINGHHAALDEKTARQLLEETGEVWVRPLRSDKNHVAMQLLKVEGGYAVLETSDQERLRIKLSKLAACPPPLDGHGSTRAKKQPPKFNGKPKENKPVIALTPEDLADIDKAEAAPPAVAAPEPVAEPPPEPVQESNQEVVTQPAPPLNPREAWRQKQIKASSERFILVDGNTGRFYTANKKWMPELALARKYTSKGGLTARGLLMGSRGHAKTRDVELVTVAQATEMVSRKTGVQLVPASSAVVAQPGAIQQPPAAPPIAAPVPAPTAAPESLRAMFDDWALKRREAALAETMRLEAMAAAAKGDAELDIAVRKRELGL